jgi:FeS assembly SUF system protein
MSEVHSTESRELAEAADSMPNEPDWLFDQSVPEVERERFSNEIAAALKTVFDPEIPCDIYELGLIYKVEIGEDRLVKIEMTLTAPGCPVASELIRSVETAVGAVGGVLGVNVSMVFDPPWDQGRMSDEARVSLDLF